MGMQMVACMSKEEYAEFLEVSTEMEAAAMCVNDLTFEEAKRISMRHTVFARRIRETYEIDPEETMTLNISSGHVMTGDG